MIYGWGQASTKRILECHPALQEFAHRIIVSSPFDLTVPKYGGKRSEEDQSHLFLNGVSHLDGVTRFGKHQGAIRSGRKPDEGAPSLAVDIAPYPIDWDDTKKFHVLAGLGFAAWASIADKHGYDLRWGGDWDRDWDLNDQNFNDLVHWELLLN